MDEYGWERETPSDQPSVTPDAHSPPPHSDHRMDEKLITTAKREFHLGRNLVVANLPADVTAQEVHFMLEDHVSVRQVQINHHTHTANVHVEHPERLDEWTSKHPLSVRGTQVQVRPSASEDVLCIAHLPLIYTDADFQNLVQMYGPLRRCFLVRSPKTGASKGYGLVEYASKEVALQARGFLDWKVIGNCTMRCDWLDPNLVTYASVQSRCLYVDHLPPDFRDVDKLRRLFSVVVKPIYCQVVLKNAVPTGVGLVEFDCPEVAEETQQRLNGYSLDEHKMRVTFCFPGVHAMTICNQLTADANVTTGKKPLLPDPPASCPLYPLGRQGIFHNLASSLVAAQIMNNQMNKSAGLLGTPPLLSNVETALSLLLASQMQQQIGGQQQPLMRVREAVNPLTSAGAISVESPTYLGPTTTTTTTNPSPVHNSNEAINSSNGTYRRRSPLLPNPVLEHRKGLLPTPVSRNRSSSSGQWEAGEDERYGWKTPLLERPKSYNGPLLGERPIQQPPSSLSPTSSVSSLASDITDNGSSPSIKLDADLNDATAGLDALNHLQAQLETLGNNPLVNLLLQATQHRSNQTQIKVAGGSSLLGPAPSYKDDQRRTTGSLLGNFPHPGQFLSKVPTYLDSNPRKRRFHELPVRGRDSANDLFVMGEESSSKLCRK